MFALTIAAFVRLRQWLRFRQNLMTLMQLDDRTLRDIGLARSDIRRAAWKGRYH